MSEALDQDFIALRTGRRWQRFRIVAMLLGLGFMLWLAWKLMQAPDAPLDRIRWAGVAAAVCVGAFANGLIGLSFADLLGKLVPQVPYRQRLAAYYHAQVAKYVPGRIAALLVQRSILRGPGATVATVVSNLELATLNAGLACAMAGVLMLGLSSPPAALILAASAIAIGTWLLRADWRPFLARLPMARGLPALAHPSRIGVARAAALSSSMLFLPAASSFILLRFGMGMGAIDATAFAALLLLSWVAGMLAFVFPVGFGVRELIFMALGGILREPPSIEVLAGVALASRMVQILIDVVGVGAYFAHARWTAPEETE